MSAGRDHDVVITGVGTVTPLGETPARFHEELAGGRIALDAPPWPLPEGVSNYFAAVRDFDASAVVDEKVLAGSDRCAQFALVAVERALQQAGLPAPDGERTGVVIGTSMGGVTSFAAGQHALSTSGLEAVDPKSQMKLWPNMAASQVTMKYGLHGPSLTTCTACAASIDAIGSASWMLRAGIADVIISGGVDAWGPLPFGPIYALGQAALGMLPSEVEPEFGCLPFDSERLGIANGEGAAMFVLERRSHAAARGARPLATVAGYASLAEGYHPSSPEPSGRWEAEAMRRAIAEAGVEPEVVYAHATGTPKGDTSEIRAINQLFGERSPEISVTSLKGNIGHTAGAAGSLNLVAALEGMRRGEVVPTGRTSSPDPEIEFRLVVGEPERRRFETALVNAFGFGGQDASLVVRGEFDL